MSHLHFDDGYGPDRDTPESDASRLRRPPYRPPIGIPIERGPSRRAAALSILLHALIVVLVLAPPIVAATRLDVDNRGAGGPGPAGGGGGGNRGTGGIFERITPERLRYVQLTPPATPPPPVRAPAPVPPPPKAEPKKPEERKREPRPEPQPDPPTAAAPTPTASQVASATPGSGGGSGKDGSAGSGPGSGGGVGSGVGTGRGSGTGPGTGGGDAKVHPPTVIALPILPIPVPSKVRPYTLEAFFEVDTLGNARLIAFNPSSDGGYNRRIREMLSEIRFRPAVRADGRPVLDTAKIVANAP